MLPMLVFLLEFLFEQHIIVPYEVVAFDTGGCRGGAIGIFFPGQHTLANSNPAVVDDLDFYHLVAGGLQDLRSGPTQQYIANVPQVQGFIRIG